MGTESIPCLAVHHIRMFSIFDPKKDWHCDRRPATGDFLLTRWRKLGALLNAPSAMARFGFRFER
jgi:hypothetical protein